MVAGGELEEWVSSSEEKGKSAVDNFEDTINF